MNKSTSDLFAEWWPLYAAGAIIYLFLDLLNALGWLPYWPTWIPIYLLAGFTIITWLWRKLSKDEKTRDEGRKDELSLIYHPFDRAQDRLSSIINNWRI